MKKSTTLMVFLSTLQIPIAPGNEEPMKTVTVCYVSSSPKKTDLAKVTEDELVDALLKINGRPRKCLGWKTPLEVFQHKVLHLI